VVPAGVAAQKVVVQRRRKEYSSRTREMPKAARFERFRTIDKGGEGHEIVQEMKVCPECAKAGKTT